MSRWNGRFHPLGEDEEPNDPGVDFPMRETFVDFAGKEREFEITLRDVQLGISSRRTRSARTISGIGSRRLT